MTVVVVGALLAVTIALAVWSRHRTSGQAFDESAQLAAARAVTPDRLRRSE